MGIFSQTNSKKKKAVFAQTTSVPTPTNKSDEESSMTKTVSSSGSSYGTVENGPASPPKPPMTTTVRKLRRTQISFIDDLHTFAEGSVPHSIVISTVIGVICGVCAWIYYTVLFGALEYFWHTLPNQLVVGVWAEWAYVLWIPLVGIIMAIGLGLSVAYLGEPGDLAFTIKAVHTKAYLGMDHVIPMVCASQFSILGGGSLGPEAPLVAICASLAGFVSRSIFMQTNDNLIRKHTLMGMAGALAAFFGAPFGGSLFALEVNSRLGIEYFEHTVEAIFCGEVTLVVFRACAGLPIEPIWNISAPKLEKTTAIYIAIGALLGLFGASIAAIFAKFHFKVMDMFRNLKLMADERAVLRALLGASVLLTIGMFFPQTLFWGEYEFQQIATMAPAKELTHVWPTSGLIGFEMDSCAKCFIVGAMKMIAISFTVAGGYRGGFIFPFFSAGAAFGMGVKSLFPSLPAPYASLCIAAGINVAITRTSLGTTIILVFLAGEQNCTSAVLAASLVSLFATSYMPFIKSQSTRSDIEESLFFEEVASASTEVGEKEVLIAPNV